MGSLNSPLGISSSDDTWNYADPKVLSHDTRPVLGVNGDWDLFCPAAGGEGFSWGDGAFGSLLGCVRSYFNRPSLATVSTPQLVPPPQPPAFTTPTNPTPPQPTQHQPHTHTHAGLKTVNMFGGPHRRFLFLGPSYGTTKHHYSHFCPLIGKDVHTEVFPHIENFISEFDELGSCWGGDAGAGAGVGAVGDNECAVFARVGSQQDGVCGGNNKVVGAAGVDHAAPLPVPAAVAPVAG